MGKVPDLYTGGYEIFTTLEGAKQREATAALRRGLLKYDHDHGYRGAEAQVSEPLRLLINEVYGEPKARTILHRCQQYRSRPSGYDGNAAHRGRSAQPTARAHQHDWRTTQSKHLVSCCGSKKIMP